MKRVFALLTTVLLIVGMTTLCLTGCTADSPDSNNNQPSPSPKEIDLSQYVIFEESERDGVSTVIASMDYDKFAEDNAAVLSNLKTSEYPYEDGLTLFYYFTFDSVDKKTEDLVFTVAARNLEEANFVLIQSFIFQDYVFSFRSTFDTEAEFGGMVIIGSGEEETAYGCSAVFKGVCSGETIVWNLERFLELQAENLSGMKLKDMEKIFGCDILTSEYVYTVKD